MADSTSASPVGRSRSSAPVVLFLAVLSGLGLCGLILAGRAKIDRLSEFRDVFSSAGSSNLRLDDPPPCTLIMADNRPLVDNFRRIRALNEYPSLAAVANYLYAQRHGCEFTYYLIKLNKSTAIARGATFEPLGRHAHNPKMWPACYHPGLKQPRASSWCKLLPSWLAAQGAASSETWAMFLDSDAFLVDHERSIANFSGDPLASPVSWGATLATSTLAFTSNKPWSEFFPVAGIYWFRPGRDATRLFARWWDVADPSHAFAHGYEQESLWMWMGEEAASISVVDVPTMEDADGQWVRHFTSNEDEREEKMISRLAGLGVTNITFAALVSTLRAKHVVELDALGVAEQMEAARLAAAAPLPSYVFPDGGNRADACSLIDCSKPRELLPHPSK